MTTKIKTFGGNIGIGTDDAGSFRLNVIGDVKADSLVINNVTNSHIPIGLIAPWYGTVETIPTGWVLCDGTTGITRSDGNGQINVPDLRNRFVQGGSSTPQVGQSGGANAITMSEANLAGHTHTFTSDDGGLSHAHPIDTKQTTHSHGENVAQGTAPHNHGNSGDANMTHNHILDTKQVPHVHGNPPSEGIGNAPHNHGTTSQSACPHNHIIQRRFATPGSGTFASRSRIHSPTATMNSGSNNMAHEHEGYDAHQAPHTHTCSTNDIPHNHDTGTENATHDHGNTANATSLHAHNIQTTNTVNHLHTTQANTSPGHTHTGTTDSTGQGTSIAIQNPYYLLAYIMKI